MPGLRWRPWPRSPTGSTYSHNARGVVNRYIGFYDGNPANLNPLPIEREAVKYVDYMGGADAVLRNAKQDFAEGEYRFVATVLNKLVTAEPGNWEARHLLADAYEQLGYQAEGPQWRNAYLTAAKELRTGEVGVPGGANASADLLAAATTENLLDSMAVRINATEAEGKAFTLNLIVPDLGETWSVALSNSNLSYVRVDAPRDADTTVTIDKGDILRLVAGQLSVGEIARLGVGAIQGSPFPLVTLIRLLEKDDRFYDMVPMPKD